MRLRSGAEVSGSKVHRIWKCQASAILPQDRSDEAEARSEPARGKGRHVHRFLERVRSVGREVALGEVPDEASLLCKALDLDDLPTHLSTEVAYAWNWKLRTARELGRNLGHRNYHLLPNAPDPTCEIPCTIDVTGHAIVKVVQAYRWPDSTTGEVMVRRGYCGDYKTGHTVYPRPGQYGQTMLGAVCIRSVLQLEDCIVELIYIDDDGEARHVRDLVDEWALDAFEESLAAALGRIPELEAEYDAGRGLPLHQGAHCAHCAGFNHCDAKTALVRAVPAELLQIGIGPATATLTPKKELGEFDVVLPGGLVNARNGAAVYLATERVIAICRALQQQVCGIAYADEPIDLGDGRVIERYVTKRREVAGPIAAVVLERRYGREKAMKALTVETSIDAIRRVVVANKGEKERIETKKGDGVLDQVLAEINKAGGVNTKVSEACKPHQRRRSKKSGDGAAG